MQCNAIPNKSAKNKRADVNREKTLESALVSLASDVNKVLYKNKVRRT